jgi:hypothetical protein
MEEEEEEEEKEEKEEKEEEEKEEEEKEEEKEKKTRNHISGKNTHMSAEKNKKHIYLQMFITMRTVPFGLDPSFF